VNLVKNATPAPTARVRLPDRLAEINRGPRQRVELPEPRDSATRLLSPVERATVRVEIQEDHKLPNSVLGEAAVRLWVLQLRGLLPHLSGHYVAQTLQQVFYGPHPIAQRLAKRGWVMLGALDAAHIGVEVTLSAEPAEGSRHFRRMRMNCRLLELEASERLRTAPR
jgi:hypothetical protein